MFNQQVTRYSGEYRAELQVIYYLHQDCTHQWELSVVLKLPSILPLVYHQQISRPEIKKYNYVTNIKSQGGCYPQKQDTCLLIDSLQKKYRNLQQ